MSERVPRWFRPEDRSERFRFDRSTGRLTPPDRAPAGGEPAPLVLYASGDIIWERDLQASLLEQPAEHAFGKIRDIWADGHLVFGQLETCFGETRAEHLKFKRISYLTDPRLIPHFAAGGFNLACQASNHTMDNGLGPIEFSRRALLERGIAVSGSGANLAEARKPAWVEKQGFKIAFLSYATNDAETNAGESRPGNAFFRKDLVLQDVLRARQKADFVLVSVHKGREFVPFPHPDHQADCRAIIDAGADVILGHHPHFQQGIEWRKKPDGREGVIFYSLGSLLVDYEPPLSKYELELFRRSQRNNYVARVELDRAGVVGITLTPVRQTENWSVRIESEEERRATWDFVEWTGHPVNHPARCEKYWITSWPYLAIQYPSLWMHWKKHPPFILNILRWLSREEIARLNWGSLFGRDMPRGLLGLRRAIYAILRALLRLIRRLLGRGKPATGGAT